MSSIWLACWLGCAPKEIPAHLQVTPPPPVVAAPPETLDEALAQILRGDPLARRPDPEVVWSDPALEAYRAAVRSSPDDPSVLDRLELTHSGTIAVPLARGWRLATLENLLQSDAPGGRLVLSWLSPLGPGGPPSHQDAIRWLPDPLAYAEHRVLSGWLDGPAIPREWVAGRLADPTFDRLALSPEGALIQASITPAQPTDLSELEQLVTLFLESAAAERDSEQQAYRAHLTETVEGDLTREAERIRDALTAQGEVGGALLAWEIARWTGDCPECTGVDRVEGMVRAGRWSEPVAELSEVARIAAAKHALDRLEVGLEVNRFRPLPVVDVLVGSGVRGLPGRLLEEPRDNPTFWLEISRATGAPETTSPAEGLRALELWVVSLIEALPEDLPAAQRAQLDRIAARLTP